MKMKIGSALFFFSRGTRAITIASSFFYEHRSPSLTRRKDPLSFRPTGEVKRIDNHVPPTPSLGHMPASEREKEEELIPFSLPFFSFSSFFFVSSDFTHVRRRRQTHPNDSFLFFLFSSLLSPRPLLILRLGELYEMFCGLPLPFPPLSFFLPQSYQAEGKKQMAGLPYASRRQPFLPSLPPFNNKVAICDQRAGRTAGKHRTSPAYSLSLLFFHTLEAKKIEERANPSSFFSLSRPHGLHEEWIRYIHGGIPHFLP